MSAAESLSAADERARRIARTVFDRPVCLQAGAGTGKTATLVARLVAWLVGKGWQDARTRGASDDPARIARAALRGTLAITFTEAAAAEMHERLALALETLARGEPLVALPQDELPDEAAARARALSDALEEPIASTIHAFARGLLARFPLEAGWQPGFTVDAEGRERERVVRELTEETLARELGHELTPAWEALFREDVGPQDLGEVLLGLLTKGALPEDLATARYDGAAIERWKRELTEALAACTSSSRTLANGGGRTQQTYEALAAIQASLACLAASDAEALEQWIRPTAESWSKKDDDKLAAWGSSDFGKREAAALGDGQAECARRARELRTLLKLRLRERPASFENARVLLLPLVAEARARLRRDNVLGFDDLLREAQRLLEHEHVRRVLQSEIRQLAVDEFQDTDAVQCALVAALALGTGERPALFLVGDPKQSIYAWRSADLEAYERFVGELAAEGAEKAELSRNFRSTAAVLDEVERWIAPAMQAEAGLQPPFQPLLADRTETPAGVALELWVPWETERGAKKRLASTSAGRASEIEAALLVRDLEQRHASGVRWKDCAVLVRAKTHLGELVEALRARGIPHEIAGDKSYYRRREVIDALSWIAAAIDPSDTVALLGALRSSAGGLPDAALPALWAENFPALAAQLAGGTTEELAPVAAAIARAQAFVPREIGRRAVPEHWPAGLLDALTTLGLLRHALAERPLAEFFELLRCRTLFEAGEAARYQGAWRLANLERLFQRLARWLEERHGDVDELLALVREDLAREREGELARPLELDTDAVRVLTIHGAKGLEFPHVYVLGLARSGKRERVPRVDFGRAEGASELVLFGLPGPHWRAVAARRERVGAAEEVRTLYVALTRARDRLVLSGSWPKDPPARAIAAARHPLDRLLLDVPAAWFAALGAAADGTGELPGRAGIVFRLPTAADLAPIEARVLPASAVELGPIGASAFVAARERARAREALPWSTSPSRLQQDPLEPGSAPSSAALGRTIGDALHRALEQWNFANAPAAERARLAAWLAREEPAASALFERFASGPLLERFLHAGRTLVARELDFLASPAEGEAACALAGAIDLVYREADGRLVVVDYKSDALADARALDERARHHAPQLRAYVRALARALPEEETPRAELWFLAAGESRTIG